MGQRGPQHRSLGRRAGLPRSSVTEHLDGGVPKAPLHLVLAGTGS